MATDFMATFNTKLTLFHSIILTRLHLFCSCFIKNAPHFARCSTHNDKCEKLVKANRRVMVSIKERLAENTRLEKQLKELDGNVNIREKIYSSRVESSGGVVDSSARAGIKMKRVTMRRKLIDLARAQTDEVEFLRQELDRLRKKTFPSFASAAMERLGGNPDELMELDGEEMF